MRLCKKKHLAFLFLSSVAVAGVAPAEEREKRWYTLSQATQGRALFSLHCAECHGKNAGATPDWRKPDENNLYPPPPLNGTAHTWHHPLPQLRLTIRNGGTRFGGKMPPFNHKLSASEIDSIIAWFQSLWPDEIYRHWATRGASQISKPRP